MSAATAPAADELAPLRKRKVRKGTKNCWECRRRKIRCTWSIPGLLTCDGCRSRSTRCIRQDSMELSPIDVSSSPGSQDLLNGSNEPGPSRRAPAVSEAPAPIRPDVILESALYQSATTQEPFEDLSIISNQLRAAWPSQDYLETVYDAEIDPSVLLHGLVCLPYERLAKIGCGKLRDLIRLPPEEKHPVQLARRLLLLATLLQYKIPMSAPNKSQTRRADEDTMGRLSMDAIRLVTSQDTLLQCVEGVECLMVESMFHSNAGDMGQALSTSRKAVAMANAIKLDHTPTHSLRCLDSKIWDRLEPDYMYWRLRINDQYLTLVLGLLPVPLHVDLRWSILPAHFDRPYTHFRAATMILQRNQKDGTGTFLTNKIDDLLHEAYQYSERTKPDDLTFLRQDLHKFRRTVLLMGKFTHHYLLIHTHAPFMLQSSEDDDSKVVAVQSARIILELFLKEEKASLSLAYCRGIDSIVFTAATILCMAHLDFFDGLHDSLEQYEDRVRSLRHTRHYDRDLLHMVSSNMISRARTIDLQNAKKMSQLLEDLVNLSYDQLYKVFFDAGHHGELQLTVSKDLLTTSLMIHIRLPHIGLLHLVPDHMERNTDSETCDISSNLPSFGFDNGFSYADFYTKQWESGGVEAALFQTLLEPLALELNSPETRNL